LGSGEKKLIVEDPVSQAYGIREYGARDPEGQL
jgi:hypothetical protein